MKFWATIALSALASCGDRRGVPTVAAASDLSTALPEIAALFTKETGDSVRLSFGSSGNFAQQILNGAPFEVFLSADEGYIHRLDSAKWTDGPGALYAIGRIGLFVPHGIAIAADSTLTGLGTSLKAGRIQKFAIANPEHAPYGRAAQAALESVGLWTVIQPTLVLGENASQATQFATSGSAQGGIIPYSLALTPAVNGAGTFVLISAGRHQPLRQRMALMNGAGTTARAFFTFLQTPPARAILERYGFALPVEDR